MVNAWGIGYSIPLKESCSFGIEVEFTYTDGTTDPYVSNFNDYSENWLCLSDVFIAKKDLNKQSII